ncbi:MAG TPA: tetraacyldisaccharide 4'-kinase [Zetaproteobacteria bacterium]|nr:tetraacyldisaccharide 4'-kinase [Zetaproteobacteria bacterium]
MRRCRRGGSQRAALHLAPGRIASVARACCCLHAGQSGCHPQDAQGHQTMAGKHIADCRGGALTQTPARRGFFRETAMRVEAMWWRDTPPPLLLRWASRIYAIINRRNLARRASAATRPAIPLISVGNITVGGSGKTPFVIWLCEELTRRGYRPVVLSRGDGGNLQNPRRILPGDAAGQVGDEALLLALRCHAPVIAGRDRVAGCRLAEKLGDVIVLDDGFQYRQLGRSCDIVLIPDEGAGNGHLLPAGPLRETPAALARADLLVRTGSRQAEPLSSKHEWRWQAEAQAIQALRGAETPATGPCLALAGIARAERFFSAAA